MESENIKQLIDQLIDRLNYYRSKKAYVAYPPLEFDLEQRIKEVKEQIEILRNLPLEQQNQINSEELEKVLGSLPLDYDEFEWQKFDKVSQINIFVTNSANVKGNYNIVSQGNVNSPITVTQNIEREKKIKPILTELPSNEKFEGRKKELAELKEQIATHKSISVISINGIGGIGKSALSKAFFLENYKEYDFALFLKGKSDVYDTFNDYTLLDNLDIAEKVHSIPYQTPNRNEIVFGIIKNALSNLEGRKLLLIDDASQNSHLLRNLKSAGWEILTTSRQKIDFMYSFELLQATPEDAIAIFCVYYGKAIENLSQEEKVQIQRLVNRLALHPLAIELVAKNIKRKDWTFEETNQKLAEKGLNIDEKTNLTTTHSQEKIKDIFEYLLQLFPLENLTEEELKLLNVYSVLPNLPITKQTWKTLLGEDEDYWQELSTGLNERGLINKNGKAFEIHALLAEIVRYKNEERLLDNCKEMIDSLISGLNWRDNMDYHKENYKHTLIYNNYAVCVVSYINIKNSNIKGILYERIGSFYQMKGNLNEAFLMFEEAKSVYLFLLEKDPNNSSFKNGLAMLYGKLGGVCEVLGDLKRALVFLKKYDDLIKQLYEEYPESIDFKNGQAIAYQLLGNLYETLGELELSITYLEKFHNLIEQLYTNFPENINFKNGLAVSYSQLGYIKLKLGNLNIALEFFTKGIELRKQLCEEFHENIDFRNKLAILYERTGHIYQELGNLKLALDFFEKRKDIQEQLYFDFSENIGFKSGLAISYQFLGGIHQELGNLKLALSFFNNFLIINEQLHEQFPDNISYKNGVAISYIRLGFLFENSTNIEKAKIYYLKAKKHCIVLTESFPNHTEFQNNLTWLDNKLKQLQ